MRTVTGRFTVASICALVLLAASAFGGSRAYVPLPETALAVVGQDQHWHRIATATCADFNITPGVTIAGYKCDESSEGFICILCMVNQDVLNQAELYSGTQFPGYEHDAVAVDCKGDMRVGQCGQKEDGSYFCDYGTTIEDGRTDDAMTQPEQS